MARARAIAVAMADPGKGIRHKCTRLAVTRGAQNRVAAPGRSCSQDTASRRLFLGRQAAPRASSPCLPMGAPGSADQGRNMRCTGEAVIPCAMPRECWCLRSTDPIGDPRPDVGLRGDPCGRRSAPSERRGERTHPRQRRGLARSRGLPASIRAASTQLRWAVALGRGRVTKGKSGSSIPRMRCSKKHIPGWQELRAGSRRCEHRRGKMGDRSWSSPPKASISEGRPAWGRAPSRGFAQPPPEPARRADPALRVPSTQPWDPGKADQPRLPRRGSVRSSLREASRRRAPVDRRRAAQDTPGGKRPAKGWIPEL